MARTREKMLKQYGNSLKEVKRRIGLLPPNVKQSPRSGAGFTLIEILISIAIFAILTAIIFFNFANEKNRTAIKSAANQIGVDVQAMQTNALGGVVTSGVAQGGYGAHFDVGYYDRYILFADGLSGTPYEYDAGADQVVATQQWAESTKVRIASLSGDGDAFSKADVTFAVPSGKAIITAEKLGGSTVTPTSLDIFLHQSSLNVCYSLTIRSNVGTINKRQLANCS